MSDETQVLHERTASYQRGMQTAELSNAMVRISEQEFVEAVEQITGRSVRAFVSGTDTEHHVSSERLRRPPGRRRRRGQRRLGR